MGFFFQRFRKRPPPQQVLQPGGGMLAYFNLSAWWFRAFSPVKRQYIDLRYQQSGGPPLAQGHLESAPFSDLQFLSHLALCVRREDASMLARIKAKGGGLTSTPETRGPG
jgi:hypothetical protein